MPSNSIYIGKNVEDACGGADLVIEAVPEDWAVKAAVLPAISAGEPGIIATNTSSFPIERLAQHVADPATFLGAHFFNPAEWIPGVEVIPGPQTRAEVIEEVSSCYGGSTKPRPGYKAARGSWPTGCNSRSFVECLRCVEEGLATPDDVDTVVSSTFGFRLPVFGPFAIVDMAGLDVYASILDLLEENSATGSEAPLRYGPSSRRVPMA